MPEPTPPNRFTLITALDYVSVGPVRTHTHALLIASTHERLFGGGIRHQMRGFVSCGASPTFDLELPTGEFSLTDAQSRDLFIGHDDKPRPLMSGAIMRVPGFEHDISLIAGHRQAIDVLRLPDGLDYPKIWDELGRRVAHNTSSGKNMLTALYMPIGIVRRDRGRPNFPITGGDMSEAHARNLGRNE